MTPTWRQGRRVPRNMYRGDEPIAMVATAEIATEIVAGMNDWEELREMEALSPCRSEEQHPHEYYWMRCSLLAPHEQRHENSDTGFRWAVMDSERAVWAEDAGADT